MYPQVDFLCILIGVSSPRPTRRRAARPEAKAELPVELARVPRDLLAPVVAADFARLRISVSIWALGVWRALHLVSNVASFEVEHGGWPLRHFYNERNLERVRREKRIVLGEHAGFLNLFVPVIHENKVVTVLVAGPLARARSTSTEVLERWHRITNSQGHLSEPTFFRYLEATLATVAFEGPLLETLQRLMACFAEVVSGHGARPSLPSKLGLSRPSSTRRRSPSACGTPREAWWDA